MDHALICQWLDLPAGSWPPDHYTLLGLRPGEADSARIEEQVHERLEVVRRYQLTHAEQATEAMNRLARAFVCLTDPVAKKAYDAGLLGEAPPEVAEAELEEGEPAVQLAAPRAPAAPRPAASPELPAAVLVPPRSARGIEDASGPHLPAVKARPASPPQAEPVVPATAVVVEELPDPAKEAARSELARRGLGTKRALYRRLARARRLAGAWERAGKYLAWPKRRVNRPAEATELGRVLGEVREALPGFPRLIGEAGQPGYLVVALSRQPAVVPTFQTLLASQREALARDWWAGRTLLHAHREFVRHELRTLRKRGSLYRALRATRSLLSEHPVGLLLALALLALAVALWRSILFTAE